MKLKLFMRNALYLTTVLGFVAAMPGTEAVAGDKKTAQQALDQRAAQMQADGTVPNCHSLYNIRQRKLNPGEITREITSVDELRRLLISGRYDSRIIVLLGSRPDKMAQCLHKHELSYYQLATNPTYIGITGAYSWGQTCFTTGGGYTNYNADGSVTRTEPCARDIDPKKTKIVRSKYNGLAVAYLLLYDKEKVLSLYKDWKDYCARTSQAFLSYPQKLIENPGSRFSDTPCMQYYPDVSDEYIRAFRQMAINQVSKYSKGGPYFEADDAIPFSRPVIPGY